MESSFKSTVTRKKYSLTNLPRFSVLKTAFHDAFCYLMIDSPSNPNFIFFINAMRIIQWVLPSFLVCSPKIYRSSAGSDYASFLSVFMQYLPVSYGKDFYFGFTMLYLLLSLITLLAFISICLHMSQHPSSTNSYSKIIFYFVDGILLIFHPMMISVSGYHFFLNHKGALDNPTVFFFLFLINLFVFFTFSYFHVSFFSNSLSFRETSMSGFSNLSQPLLLLSTSLMSFLSYIAVFASPFWAYLLVILMGLIYIFIFICVLYFLRFINHRLNVVFLSSTALAVFILIHNSFFIYNDSGSPAVLFFSHIFVFLLFYLITDYFVKKLNITIIKNIDEINKNYMKFDNYIANLFVAYLYMCVGFLYGCQPVIDISFINMVIERWRLASFNWYLKARIMAITTKDIEQLTILYQNIYENGYSFFDKEAILAQLAFLINYRDSSTDNTSIANESYRLISVLLNRIKHFWECVNNGNIQDIEVSSLNTKSMYELTENKVVHLVHQYPNVGAVKKLYHIFLGSVRFDPEGTEKWSLIKRDIYETSLLPDVVNLNGFKCFPRVCNVLPNIAREENREEPNKDDKKRNSLLVSIYQAITEGNYSSMSFSIKMLSFVVFAFYFIYIPFMVTRYYIVLKDSISDLALMETASLLRDHISRLSFMTIRHLGSSIKFEPGIENITLINSTFYYCLMKKETKTPFQIASEAIYDVDYSINKLRSLRDTIEAGQYIKEANSLLFEGGVNFTLYSGLSSNISISTESRSAESIALRIITTSLSFLSTNSTVDVFSIVSKTLQLNNYLAQTTGVTDGLNTVCNLVQLQVEETGRILSETAFNAYFYGSIVFCVLLVFVMINTIIRFESSKNSTNRCFLLIPKQVVNQIYQSFQLGISFNNEHTTIDTTTANMMQLDASIAALSTANTSKWKFEFPLYAYIISIIVGAFIGSHFLKFGYDRITEVTELEKTIAPYSDYFLGIHTNILLCLYNIYRITAIDSGIPFAMSNRSKSIYLSKLYFDRSTIALFRIKFGCLKTRVKPIYNVDSEFALLAFDINSSKMILNDDDMHSFAMRLSPFAQINYILTLLPELFLDAQIKNLSILDGRSVFISHLLFAHLYDGFFRNHSTEIAKNTLKKYDEHFEITILYSILFYFIALIAYSYSILKLKELSSQIAWFLKPLMHCPPDVIVASNEIINTINGSSISPLVYNHDYSEDICERIFNMGFNYGIIKTNKSLSVEYFNDRATNWMKNPTIGDNIRKQLAFTNHNLMSLISNVEKALYGRTPFDFTYLLEMDDSNTITSVRVICLNQNIVVEPTCVHNISITSLVFIIQDKTEEVIAEKEFEKEKNLNQELFMSILPSKLVASYLNDAFNSELFRDIATGLVGMISIDYDSIKDLSPYQMIHDINIFHERVSSLASKYDNISIIRYSATELLCIAYLGSGKNSSSDQVYSSVEFFKDCLKNLDKINMEKGSNMICRIGIDYGGPIKMGVLTIQHPILQAIGIPIERAKELQKYCPPMRIIISRGIMETMALNIPGFNESRSYNICGTTIVTLVGR